MAMEQAELERARQKFEREVRTRLAGLAFDRIELLQYGDDPEVEPGELLGKVVIALPEGADPDDETVHRQALEALDANREALHELRDAFGVREFRAGIRRVEGHAAQGDPGPVITMKMDAGDRVPVPVTSGDQPLTAVMARLGPEDLETLDTLITAGIAGSRAEAVRWTLARIRERPAYEQIRARSREIEELKSQF
jgi:hypothetical protein